ncbi:D-isomer specific 2-hydroxyacid dehydrogenase, NAD-binding [Thermosinus carboxydivorans Nor1]|uniref:D-isomer specific 2-hydroxyacid dehydrogenase, NAD-binding n=1 Tax=Thermosinus carboxydivorans Nor1 TaxID=401526 RepID=A1HQD8_9FIRM|nr:D-glycerate dehydrogenase [Thermosinus carboxydivorans]EAX47745.1 D-isomer specific 2-hydroxyacid dehydrogenase, NAD-binding [Thermosinus carboxydivorans Nor1]
MAQFNVYVTRRIPDTALDVLRQRCNVEVNPEDRVLTRDELLAKVTGRDAVLCLLTDTIDDAVLAAAGKQCRIFANYAVGYNNIDVAAATKRGIFISNTPDVLTAATADMAWALLFAVARRVVEGDKFTRAGKFHGWGPLLMLGQEVTGKTVGIIGAGRIGAAFARRAKGFDMKILYTGRSRKPDFERETGATYVDFDTLLREADFISLHVPLTPETYHLIGERELKLMKPTAILINTARGPVVDEKALVAALRRGEIWGAGLDVFENEPALAEGLAELDNVVIPPHLGSATLETRTKMGLVAVENILAALDGRMPPNCLNPEARNFQ